MKKMLIAMAGLPGTGKSAIADNVGRRLHAPVLNKDDIREKLFSSAAIDFSQEQDDLCMEVIFIIAEYLLSVMPEQTVIIDGRTFSRSYQVEQLLSRAEALKATPVIMECICDRDIAKERLDHDHHTGAHPAGNRTFKLYLALEETAEPITADHLVIDTGKEPLERSVDRCVAYVRSLSH
jgi:predicted kinase